MSTHPMGCSVVPVDESSMPTRANRPPSAAITASEPSAESTGNQASVLSARSTAHERLAISQEVWKRLMPSSIDARRPAM